MSTRMRDINHVHEYLQQGQSHHLEQSEHKEKEKEKGKGKEKEKDKQRRKQESQLQQLKMQRQQLMLLLKNIYADFIRKNRRYESLFQTNNN